MAPFTGFKLKRYFVQGSFISLIEYTTCDAKKRNWSRNGSAYRKSLYFTVKEDSNVPIPNEERKTRMAAEGNRNIAFQLIVSLNTRQRSKKIMKAIMKSNKAVNSEEPIIINLGK